MVTVIWYMTSLWSVVFGAYAIPSEPDLLLAVVKQVHKF